MKKYFALIGAMILVMALSSSALAAGEWMKEFKATSQFQMWSVWESKYDFGNSNGTSAAATDNTRRGLSQRINFFLDWGNSKYVRGVIGFEADSTNWGEQAWTHTHVDGGAAASNPSGKMGVGNTDQAQLEIKHAYLQFTIPNTPVMVSYGIQGFYIGGRLGQSRDIPGLIVTAQFAPHSIRAIWWRENEGYAAEYPLATSTRNYYHTNDTYGLTYDLSQKLFNVSAWFLYKNDLVANASSVTVTEPTYRDNPYWIGIGGGFRPGNVGLSGQIVYLGGKRDYIAASATDQDFSAWAAEILATYQIGPGLSVGLEGYYGSGADTGKTDKISAYATPTGSEAYANFGYGRTVLFWMAFSQFGYQHQITTGYGYWYARLNAQYAPVKWANLSFNYLYLNDTSTGTNTIGRTDVDKTFIGHEINLITTLKIYQNFTWNIGIGALIPGEVLDHPDRKGDTAFGVNTGMQLAF